MYLISAVYENYIKKTELHFVDFIFKSFKFVKSNTILY